MATAANPETVNGIAEWTKPPFLRRVRIRGYKSIAFCDVPLQPLTILVGRNGAGKSNFLNALAFLRDVLDSSVTKAVELHGGWSSVVCRTASVPMIEIEIEAGFSCSTPRQEVQIINGEKVDPSGQSIPDLSGRNFVATYLLQVSAREHATPLIRREKLDLRDETGELTGGFDLQRHPMVPTNNLPPGLNLFLDVLNWRGSAAWPSPTKSTPEGSSSHRSDQTLLGAIGFSPFVDLGDGLRWMGFYNFHPDALRTLQKPLPGVMLKKDGGNLASVIESLNEIDPHSLDRVQAYLSTIVEEVERFSLVRYGEYHTIQFRLRSGSTGPSVVFDAASMSDGTLRVLSSLIAAFQIHLPSGPSLIGIEEPETALHPAAMRSLVDALDEATQRTQILLTTHSADLLSGRDVTPGQVLVVRNRGGQTQITPVDPASREIIDKELYSLADLQRMDRLDLDEVDLTRQAQTSKEARGV